MPEDKQEFLTAPIDDYLLSIADSLQQVQQRLNQNRILSTDGQSSIVYQIPRLDFELKMSMEIEQQSTENGQPKPVLRGAPASSLTSTKRQIAEAASTIKGSFVAVPSEGGQPTPVIGVNLHKVQSNEYRVTVQVQSAVGTDMKGVKVEFNVSRDLSKEWSKQDSILFRWYDLEPAQAVAEIEEVEIKNPDGSGTGNKTGTIKSIKVTNPGRGYLAPPKVTITPVSGGATATARIDDRNENVVEVVVDNGGTGYSVDSPPKIDFNLEDGGATINIPKVNAYFEKGVVLTDDSGKAENTLKLEGLFPKRTSIVTVIDVLGKTETIVYQI